MTSDNRRQHECNFLKNLKILKKITRSFTFRMIRKVTEHDLFKTDRKGKNVKVKTKTGKTSWLIAN